MNKIKRILLIDDDRAINFLNKAIIKKKACAEEILDYEMAEEALMFLKENNNSHQMPDLILLDINMPVMDGWEFVEQYGKIPEENRNAVIVLLTSSISPADKSRADAISEIAEFRSKPLTFEMLDEIISLHYNGFRHPVS